MVAESNCDVLDRIISADSKNKFVAHILEGCFLYIKESNYLPSSASGHLSGKMLLCRNYQRYSIPFNFPAIEKLRSKVA
jgi:hypothetical protein